MRIVIPVPSVPLRIHVLVACAISLCPATALAQQGRWQLDLTGSRIEFDTASVLNAPSVAGLGEFQNDWLLGRFTGGLTGFGGGAWSFQGQGDASALGAPFGSGSPLRFEASGSAGGSRHSSGFESILARADLRMHLAGPDAGVWAGFSAITAKNSFDLSYIAASAPSAGVWGQSGAFRVTAGYQHLRIEGETFPEANVAASHNSDRIEWTLYAGGRGAPPGTALDRKAWGGGSIGVWFQPSMAVVLSAGNYPAELLQGLPGGRYLSLGFRITDRRKRPTPARSLTTPMVFTQADVNSAGIDFDVAGAATVEIAGDWNAWIPTPLSRNSAGRWILNLNLDPGVYRFSLRVDGTRWTVPPEVPQMEDGFGGRVGLLIVS